ncbi:chemotaxis protein [Anaerosporomusa subterranea]|uniref:Chemotaxis protein n=1 Tax=Anaerosporomusa subterranea TaxID=1794912 RepID=A0A154BVM8_ANASB|nr:methyl-accepting chemotaxis protein [Anaerosporomusa subterranea]KYZ77992.1 chemotaxis protein [Anaerosporomusa subterranea]
MNIKSVQTRLLLWLLPLIFVVLSVLSGVSYYISKQSLDQSIGETAEAIGTDYGYRIKGSIQELMIQLEDMAKTQTFRTGTDKAQISAAMAEIQKRIGFETVLYISPDGSAIRGDGTTGQYRDREYFKKVLDTKKAYVSEPLTSRATGKMSFFLAVPVMNNGQLIAITGGTYSLEKMTDLIKDLKFLDTGYGQISDDSGTIIAHPKNPGIIGKLNLAEKKINAEIKLQQNELDDRLIALFTKAAQSGQQTHGVYSFVDGVARYGVYTPIDLPGGQRWVMGVSAPETEATQDTDALARTVLIISLICLLIVAVSIVFIAKQFTKPIALIRDECLLLAQGDLREREAKVSSEDEVGQLAQGFRQMRINLRELVAKVHSQSEQLAASSEQLTASADQSAQAANQVAASITDVATGAAEQLAAANDTSAVVEQISASIQEVAATTNGVAAQSAQAAAKANDGSKSVNKAISQMTQIEQTVNTSAKVVAELGERSKEIGQIVDAISGIAGQTNLLALNAAIEAARAGEQGRGFAVVADEVRKLAEQSQEAAKQIAELIGGIQGETDKAVSAMNDGTREVKVGAEVVNAAGQAFQEIVALVTQVSDQIKDISTAIEQMAIGSQQIVTAVNRIDGLSKKASGEAETVSAATEEQSASMQEIASSSQSLSNLAMDLREAVGKFRV